MEIINMIESGDIEGFLKKLDDMAASKAYVFIRDNMQQKHIKMIRESGDDNYKLYQDIKIRAKKSWDYDHKVPIMEDINRACANVYTLVLRIMKVTNDDTAEELNKIKRAINRIEEKLSIEQTKWDNNGGNINDNVQRVEEDI